MWKREYRNGKRKEDQMGEGGDEGMGVWREVMEGGERGKVAEDKTGENTLGEKIKKKQH